MQRFNDFKVKADSDGSFSLISPRCFMCPEPWEFEVTMEGINIPVYLCKKCLEYARTNWVRKIISAELKEGFPRYDEVEWIGVSTSEHDWEKYYKLKPGDVFVEAGAFRGSYAELASKKVGPTGRVILIEPSPSNFPALQGLVQSRGLTNVTLINKAVANKKGKRKLYVYYGSARHGIVMEGLPKTVWEEAEEVFVMVEADTLDNMMDELGITHIDLLGADVEAAEAELIEGANRLLSEKRIHNVAIAAYHTGQMGGSITVTGPLREKGYKDVRYEKGVAYARAR